MRILTLSLVLVVVLLFGTDVGSQTTQQPSNPNVQVEQDQQAAPLEVLTNGLLQDADRGPDGASSDFTTPSSDVSVPSEELLTSNGLDVAAEIAALLLTDQATTPSLVATSSQSKGGTEPAPTRGAVDRLTIKDIDVDAALVRQAGE